MIDGLMPAYNLCFCGKCAGDKWIAVWIIDLMYRGICVLFDLSMLDLKLSVCAGVRFLACVCVRFGHAG